MIVTKFVNVETAVDVRIDADDIFESLAHLKNYNENIIPAFLSIKDFLDAIKDFTIAEMTHEQRKVIAKFLNDSADRFDVAIEAELS